MLTLHVVTEDIRASLKWGAIAIVGIIVLISVFNLIKATLFRPKPSLPTMSYGLLPAIPFPKNSTTQPLSYILNTVDGTTHIIDPTTNQVKVIPDRMNIYKIIRPQPDLTSLQTSNDEVQAIGFVTQDDINQVIPAQRLSDTEYEWDKNYGLPQSLTMDIASHNFHLTSQYLNYPAVLSASNAPTDSSAINTVQNVLSAMQLTPTDIDTSLTTTTDYVIVNGIIRPAQPGENVMAVRVNFFQNAVDGYQIFYPSNPNTAMSFLVTGGDTQAEIAQATFVHQVIDSSTSSTYPIKTADQAYADLQAGKGYITLSYTGGNSVNIRTVNLGYYMGEVFQDYLMPVYVFQGDNNFTAYVSAVTDNETTTAQPSPAE